MFNINIPPNLPPPNPPEVFQLKSMPLQDNPQIRSNYEHLPQDLQLLFLALFNNSSRTISLKDLLPFHPKKTKTNICNKILVSKEISFRCFDCLLHEGSLICQQCFREGNHNHHRYSKVREEGSCDCGNRNILKQTGHCSRHLLKGDDKQVEIHLSEKIKFGLYIKQLFIWGFEIWSKVDMKNGAIFTMELIKYLTELNTQSLYYNRLTTEVLFHGQLKLMSSIFEVCLVSSEVQKQVTQKFIELLLIMYPCQEFKQKILQLMIEIYNKVDWFQSSKFDKVLIVLLSDPKTVQQTMLKSKQTLNPTKRRYNPLIYYKHLLMAEFLKPQIAQLFLTPLIFNDYLNSIVLDRIEVQCEGGNSDLLSILSEHIQEEYLYYKVLMMTIGIISSKQTLAKMVGNYYKMFHKYSFKKNTVLLIPHRILTLLIYKYFDFNITKLDVNALCSVIGEPKERVLQFIYKYFKQIVGCLGQFSLDLVRNTYFYNYRLIYTSEESQMVMVDYLAMKIVAYLYINSPQLGSFSQTLLEKIYREDISDIESKPKDRKKDYFDKWNKLLEVFAQIIYNSKVQIINSIFLGEEERVKNASITLIERICKKLGKIHVSTWQIIQKNVFYSFRKSKENWIEEVLVFDKDSCKYQLKHDENLNSIEDINFDRMMSLTHSRLANLLTNEKPKPIHLDPSANHLFHIMLDQNTLNQFLIFQLDFAKNQFFLEEMFLVIPETIRITKNINLFLPSEQPFIWFYQECLQVANNLKLIYSQKYQSKMIDKSQALIKDLTKLIKGEQESTSELSKQIEEEREKKKLLLQMKKEKLMKERKMKENQQKYIQENKDKETKTEKQLDEQCLICKEKSEKSNLCYLAKARLNNVLFQIHRFHEKHIMFFSCLHMVHFSCFKQQIEQKKVIPCPLCYSASNIVIPHESAFPNNKFLPEIYKHLLKSFSNIYKHTYDSLYLECFIFLVYVTLLNLEKQKVSDKQVNLYRSLFGLMLYEATNNENKKKDIMEEFKETNNFNIEKDPKNLLRRYLKISSIFLENTVKLKLSQNKEGFQQLQSETDYQLQKYFSEAFSKKVLKTLTCFVTGNCQKEQKMEQKMIASQQKLIKFKELPSSLTELFQLRDESRCKKSYSHLVVICILCGERICSDCQQLKKHTEKAHLTESLFFNLDNGGLKYCHLLEEIVIQSMFINKIGILWSPEAESKDYFLDQKILNKFYEALTAGNLFYFITHLYSSLKVKNIPDII